MTSLSQTLQKEIQGHQPRIDDILERSQSLLQDESSNTDIIRQRPAELQELWRQHMEEAERRHGRLEEAHKAQQYYFDAAEAEAWMSEQELYMMSEEKAKVGRGRRWILLDAYDTITSFDVIGCLCVSGRAERRHHVEEASDCGAGGGGLRRDRPPTVKDQPRSGVRRTPREVHTPVTRSVTTTHTINQSV